jgi:hypothetical protein
MNRKTLRPYQARLVTDVCRVPGDVLVEQPTGSGKTMQIVTLVAMQLGRRFTHAVISAPQEQIEHGFVRRDYRLVAFPEHRGVATPAVAVPNDLIWGARQSQLGSVRRLLAYLRQAGPLDHALACTHAALNRLTHTNLPDDLSGKALFIDEAHHAPADGLSQVVSVWRERGGQLFFFTATPYRGDGRPVALEGMHLFRRSLAEHMAEGFAPGHLDSEIVALGNPGDKVTGGVFHGEEPLPSKDISSTVEAICRRWLDDGKPKAIVRVPPMRGGSGGLVSQLIHALASHGARVLNATGTGAQDQQRFLAALASEQNQTFAGSNYDIIVGIQRVLEGTDWPVCSAVYCVGMPGSLNTVVQLLGRAMRPKGDGYPSSQRDRARLVFFVPCGGGSALADLSLDHSRHALLTCCFLADHEVGQEWVVLREVRRGIEDALGSRDENPAAADAENEANVALDPEVRSEIELVMANACEQITSDGGQPTLGEVVQLAAKTRPDLPEAALHRVAAEILASQPGSSGAVAREAIHKEVAKRLRIDPMVKRAMEEAFAVVLNEFRAVTLKHSPALVSVGRQVHGVTGGQMREFAQRLRDAVPRPLTEEQILAWADAYHQEAGQWPRDNSGLIDDISGETWKAINVALAKGLRGLAGGSSLAQLLAQHRGVRNQKDLPELTIDQILAWVDAYHERTGKWPVRHSGAIEDAPGESWMAVEVALNNGNRGLPGGSSLPKLLTQLRGVRNIGDLPALSPEQILAWADAHFSRTGQWPKHTSGHVNEAPGETWRGIAVALVKGQRGLLPGGSSLPKLLAEYRSVRNHKALPKLTKQQVLVWADAHYQRTGRWPTSFSGPVAEALTETWAAIDSALNKGGRGLPSDSSLATLLLEERGIRHSFAVPPLTKEQILAWVDGHHERTGQWPRVDSGAVFDAPGETWRKIDGALRGGFRGLSPGSSLAQLLAEQRGVRNPAAPPELTIEQILSWADVQYKRTGRWPNVNSGPVVGAQNETWSAINACLREGLRALPGGSSLAEILARERGVRTLSTLPPLTTAQILAWADAHYERTVRWPGPKSGAVADAPGEKWANIQQALQKGLRGLAGGSSLARLIKEHRKNSAI